MDRLGGAFSIKTVDFGSRIISGWAAYHNNIDRVDDIIEPQASVKAVARLKSPSQVGVFVGHDMSRLPVGIPVKVEAHPEGLFVETKIFDGPTGDDLLGVARGLREAGQSLGMSIGYRLLDGKRDRVNGKTIRRITDYSLHEYSFAASQAIANTSALVTGVKTVYSVKEMDGRFHVMKDGTSKADYASEDEARSRCDMLNKDDAGKTMPNTLPDSAFLYVQPGGQLDDEGKTVPRTFRHFRIRDAAGDLDREALEHAVKTIPDASVSGLDADEQTRMYAQARAYLEGHKTDLPAVALDMLAVAYRLIDASDSVVTEHKALTTLGESTNEGRRMRPETREMVSAAAAELTRLVERAEMIERGEDGKALTDWWAAQFDLMEVAS